MLQALIIINWKSTNYIQLVIEAELIHAPIARSPRVVVEEVTLYANIASIYRAIEHTTERRTPIVRNSSDSVPSRAIGAVIQFAAIKAIVISIHINFYAFKRSFASKVDDNLMIIGTRELRISAVAAVNDVLQVGCAVVGARNGPTGLVEQRQAVKCAIFVNELRWYLYEIVGKSNIRAYTIIGIAAIGNHHRNQILTACFEAM